MKYLIFIIIFFTIPFNKGHQAWKMYVTTGTKIANPYKSFSKKWNEWQAGWHSIYNGTSNVESKVNK